MGQRKLRHFAAEVGHDALSGLGAYVRQLPEQVSVTALDGQGNLIEGPDQALERTHKTDARNLRKGLKKLAIQRIKKAHQLGRQVAAGKSSVDVINGVEGQRILPLVFRRLPQPGGNARRDKDFVTECVDTLQQGIVRDAIIKDFAGDF